MIFMVVHWLSLHSIPLIGLFFTNTTLSCLQQRYSESWNSDSIIPLTLSSLSIVLVVLCLLPLWRNLIITLSISTKQPAGILAETAWNL